MGENVKGNKVREYLKDARTKKGLTQAEVGVKMDIGASTYTMVELGERQKDLNLSWIVKLSDIFEMPINLIIAEEKKYKEGLNA